jgi:ribosomal protein S18 acetylase RimI-like enzyme
VGDRYAELYSLSVAPDERAQGVGTALFEAVERELASHGIADLTVAVMAGNTSAMRFYQRRGLRPGEILLYRFDRHR